MTAAAEATAPPFFFMVGAGVSHPEIPLASHIVQHCISRSADMGQGEPDPPSEPLNAYSYWFERAYPEPIQRQRYLRAIAENAKLSMANLQLAHLLSEASIARTLLTTNFDDSVSRALRLFFRPHLVFDHPSTATRLEPGSADIQVAHVHGTYWFYDCCNLTTEITGRASGSSPMFSAIRQLLGALVPIVIGYSGWEQDVFMTALRARLNSPLPYSLYWFCHTEGDAINLAGWLHDHPNVVVVTPGSEATQISASHVLGYMIREAGIPAPKLTQAPLLLLAEVLERQLPTTQHPQDDPYQLSSVLETVKSLAAHAGGAHLSQHDPFAHIRDALRRNRPWEALSGAFDVDTSGLNERDKQALRELLLTTRKQFSDVGYPDRTMVERLLNSDDFSEDDDRGAAGLLDYDLWLSLLGLSDRDPSIPSPLATGTARVWFDYAMNGLEGSERRDALLRLVERYRGSANPATLSIVARARYNLAYEDLSSGRHEDAIRQLDELIGDHELSPLPEHRQVALRAKNTRGRAYEAMGQPERALAEYESFIARYSDDGMAEEEVRRARIATAMLSSQRGNWPAVVASLDPLLRQGVEPHEGEELGLTVFLGLLYAEALLRVGRRDEATAFAQTLAYQYANHPDEEVRDLAARAAAGAAGSSTS